MSQYSQESTCVEFSFLIKLQGFRSATLLKRGSKQVFSCASCKVFNIFYFEEHLQRTASKAQFQVGAEIQSFDSSTIF